MKPFILPLLVLFALAAPADAQNAYLAVIVGLAGDPTSEDGDTFHKWATTLIDAAEKRLGIPRERIAYLSDKVERDPKRISGRSTREEIAKTLDAMARSATDTDPVFIVLIGHGTADARTAKFNLPGPDMTAAEFKPLLDKFQTKRLVFVNTASASGPFVETLAAPGRTIVTATRNGAERFSTIFGGYFVDAFVDDKADTDKNGRITVNEAYEYAKREVANTYERQGIMATEHALLEGKNAEMVSLGAPAANESLPVDPKLRGLYEERRALERRVDALKLMKESMEPQKYAAELEKLLTDLALKTRQIREAEKK